jgi:hypothetical protein
MKRKISFNNLLLIGLFLTIPLIFISCGTTKSTIAFHEEATNIGDSSLIYIYRYPSMVGRWVPWLIRLDGKVVASLKQKAYIVLKVAPGKHAITIGDKTTISGTGKTGDMVLNAIATQMELKARENGIFTTTKNQVLYFRSKGFKVSFLTRDEAIVDLVYMKYDKGL